MAQDESANLDPEQIISDDAQDSLQHLIERAKLQGIGSARGTIRRVGRDKQGQAIVQFVDETTNVSAQSVWPEWAFEFAKEAFLSNKVVLIFYNDYPVGRNFTAVYLLPA